MEDVVTKVVFRWGDDWAAVIALFPEEVADSNGHCGSYMHIGQHGPADYEYVMSITKPATLEEYQELKAELEDIGYRLEVTG